MREIALSPLLRKKPYTGSPGFQIVLTGRGPELRAGGCWVEIGTLPPGGQDFTARVAALASGLFEQRASGGAPIAFMNDFLDATLVAGAAIACPRTPKTKLDKLLLEARRHLERPTLRRDVGKEGRPGTRLRQLTRAAALARLNTHGDWKEALWSCAWEFEALHALGLLDGKRNGAQAVAELLAARIVHAALIDPRLSMPPDWQTRVIQRELVRDGIFPPGFSLDATGEDFP